MEVYGTCAQVAIVDRQDNVVQSRVTSEGAPNVLIEDRTTTTAGSSNSREESRAVSCTSAGGHQFHHLHGRHVCLLEDRTVAKRIHGFDDGVLFSHLPLQPGDVFEVKQ